MAKSSIHPIRRARQALHLTQEALARKVKVQKAAISKWENGKGMPRPASAKRLVAALAPELKLDDVYRSAA